MTNQPQNVTDLQSAATQAVAASKWEEAIALYAEALVWRNAELAQAQADLKLAQAQLAQAEKMAALGQLIAGIAHEINTPLGAISASIDNITAALADSLSQLPQLFQQLSLEQQQDFFKLVDRASSSQALLSAREERQARRALRGQLENQAINQADTLADLLVDMGIFGDVEVFQSLLQSEYSIFIIQTAYNLVSQQKNSRTIKTAVERAAKIVFALKTYARQDYRGEMVEVDITEGLELVLTLYHNQLKHGVEVIRHYEEAPFIRCYPDELNQVWTNLIHNALQAMQNQGTLEIGVRNLELEDWRLSQESISKLHSPLCNCLAVEITDTGPGIPDEIKARIFEPFFTTKPAGEGSGLGLDIVRKIVAKHEGRIEVDSRPGRTTFRVLLPLTQN